MAENTKRRVRNTFNFNTGLPVMVNLLIIRTIYYGMKNKADRFVLDDTKHKKKYVPVYDILTISRARYDRLQRGTPFEISKKEARHLANLFNISIEYFTRDNPDMFELDGVDAFTWKCYYSLVREVEYTFNQNVKANKKEEHSEIIKNKLKELASREWDNETDDDNPLFRIWYYFRTGKAYDKTNPAVSCMTGLQNLPLEQWKSLYEDEALEQYRDILKRHYEYVNALVTIKKMK